MFEVRVSCLMLIWGLIAGFDLVNLLCFWLAYVFR